MFAKFRLIFILLAVYFSYFEGLGAQNIIRRICVSAFTRQISVYCNRPKDTCLRISRVYYFGYKLSDGSRMLLDSTPTLINDYTLKNTSYNNLRDSFTVEVTTICNLSLRKVFYTKRIDIDPPKALDLDSVSIDNGQTILGWTPSNSKDVVGYIIYKSNGVQNNPLDTLYGKSINQYIDNKTSGGTSGSAAYKIAPFDSCFNVADLGNADSTIYLNVNKINCTSNLTLKWTNYFGWSVSKYELYVSQEGGAFSLLKAGGSTFNKFNLINPVEGQKYSFFVRAFKSGDLKTSSSSNVVSIIANKVNRPKYVQIASINSFNGNHQIRIVTDSGALVNKVYFYQSSDSIRFKLIDTFRFIGTNQILKTIGSSPKTYFKVEYSDLCNVVSKQGYISNPIRVSVQFGDLNGYSVRFNLTHIRRKVSGYTIYRNSELPDSNQWIKLADITDTSLFYHYFDKQLISTLGNEGVCYYIEELYDSLGDSLNHRETPKKSISGIVCAPEQAKVWIPNAFKPGGGINETFKIITLYADLNQSSYSIYNRWGQKVLSNTSLLTEWNGGFENDASKRYPGIYFYQARITDKNGNTKEYSGTILLLD